MCKVSTLDYFDELKAFQTCDTPLAERVSAEGSKEHWFQGLRG